MQPLNRVSGVNDDLDVRTGATSIPETLVDQQSYFAPWLQAHGATSHTWGVVSHLEVTKAGATGVLVKPGIALDSEGRVLVLADDGGKAVTDPGWDPSDVAHTPTEDVTDQGIEIKTASLQGGEYTVTIQFGEKLTYISHSEAPYQMVQTPWLRLWRADDPPPDDGTVVILAEVELDDQGQVIQVVPGRRRLAGLPAGSLTLRRPRSGGDLLTVDQVDAVELRADEEGLDISASVHVTGELKVDEALTVGGKQVIDESGKWVGDPAGLSGKLTGLATGYARVIPDGDNDPILDNAYNVKWCKRKGVGQYEIWWKGRTGSGPVFAMAENGNRRVILAIVGHGVTNFFITGKDNDMLYDCNFSVVYFG